MERESLFISSTQNQLWEESYNLCTSSEKKSDDTIVIDKNHTKQTMDAFPWGGCFNERGYKAMQPLCDADRQKIINSLFGTDGLNLCAARTPMAASDYAIIPYSYCMTENDYEMKNFSIERDDQYLIPYIKSALTVKPDLKIFATPWSPPAWMKKNHSLLGGRINFTEENMTAYALYFKKYLESYKKKNIHISAVTIQNEPTMDTAYASCLWTGEEINLFIRDYLHPVLQETMPEVEIWLGTFTDSNKSLVMPSLKDKKTMNCISAIAFQWWGAPLAAEIYDQFPDIRLVQSETKCGDGKNNWTYAEEQFDCFREFLDAGVRQYFLWNLVLDEKGANTAAQPWLQNAPITVNTVTGEITYNPSYYMTKHFTGLIKPGAKKVVLDGTYTDAIAFLNPDGEIVVEMKNSTDCGRTVSIIIEGTWFNVILKAHSINTFLCKNL